MQKGFTPIVILIGIAVIALVGGGTVYLNRVTNTKKEPIPQSENVNKLESSNKQQPSGTDNQNRVDETVSWQIYESPNKDYSFKYPKEGTLSNYNEGTYKGVMLRFLGSTQTSSGRTETSLTDGLVVKTLLITNMNQSLQEFAESQRKVELNTLPEAPTVSSLSQLTINGQTAFTYTLGGTSNAKVVFVKIEKGILKMSGLYEGDSAAKTKYLNLFDQILTTFKFSE